MIDPEKTYRGVPYYFGIDPVSTARQGMSLVSVADTRIRRGACIKSTNTVVFRQCYIGDKAKFYYWHWLPSNRQL